MSQVAQASVPGVSIYDTPSAPKPSNLFPNPWYVNNQRTAIRRPPRVPRDRTPRQLVSGVATDPTQRQPRAGIRARDVRITAFPYRITVELAAHRITVYDGESILLQEPVAVGKPSTPTPPGRYFLRILWKAPNPNTVYGPYAYGLSGYSNVLTSFDGGDGELGIHGNDDASVLGSISEHHPPGSSAPGRRSSEPGFPDPPCAHHRQSSSYVTRVGVRTSENGGIRISSWSAPQPHLAANFLPLPNARDAGRRNVRRG